MPTRIQEAVPPKERLDMMRRVRRGEHIEVLENIRTGYGDHIKISVPGTAMHFVSNADLAKHVLDEQKISFEKDPAIMDGIRLVTGKTAFTSTGSDWELRRTATQPSFHPSRMDYLVEEASAVGQDLTRSWSSKSEVSDIVLDLVHANLEALTRFLFGYQLGDECARFAEVLTSNDRFILQRTTAMVPLPQWVPTPAHRTLQNHVAFLRKFVRREIVRRKIAEQKSPSDENTVHQNVLANLLATPNQLPLTDDQLENEMMSLLAAGHDTAAGLLMWTVALISRHPSIRQEIQQEIDEVLKDQPITFDLLNKLNKLQNAIREALRLYPPSWSMSRLTITDNQFQDVNFSKGDQVILSVYGLHRSEQYWDQPDKFRPSRFDADAPERQRFSYLPFGYGARNCQGALTATTTTAAIVAELLRNNTVEAQDPHAELEAEAHLGLHIGGTFPINFLARHTPNPT